jgi:hypothetical protein
MSSDEVFQAEPARTGMSGASKVLIALGVGFGVLLLVCCGGFVGMGWWVQSYAEKMFSEDPEIIAETTDDITDVEIPEQFAPAGAIDIDIPFVEETFMSMSFYKGQEEGDALVIAQFGEAWTENSEGLDIADQVRDSLEEQGEGTQEMTIEKSDEVELTIRGEPATFVIERGTGNDSDEEMWRVSGAFKGKGGAAFLLLQAKTDNLTREQIDELLESLE